ncbi:MAG: three-helix bundle dimerization domain-containing protein [Planctomycetota bacterium]
MVARKLAGVQLVGSATPTPGLTEIDAGLVERIWRQTGGRFSQEQIRRVATEVASEFHDARVTAFVPVIIQRKTSERLESLSSAE